MRLLLARGADINGSGIHGQTPLCSAAVYGDLDVFRALLVEGGVDVNKTMYDSSTPLYAVCDAVFKDEQGDCVRMLLENHTDVKAKCDGMTPLHIAASRG